MNSKKNVTCARLPKNQVIAEGNLISDLWWKLSLCTYHKLREKWTILVIIRNRQIKNYNLSQGSLLTIVLQLKVDAKLQLLKGRKEELGAKDRAARGCVQARLLSNKKSLLLSRGWCLCAGKLTERLKVQLNSVPLVLLLQLAASPSPGAWPRVGEKCSPQPYPTLITEHSEF